MYRAKNQGLVIDSRGQAICFDLGSLIDAEKGSLDHCDDLEWIETRAKSDKRDPDEKIDMSTVLDKALNEQVNSVKKPRRGKRA